MKLNNKGFAISTVMYMILILAVIIITLTLSILSSRKLILDKIRRETNNIIYNVYDISYRQALSILKEEAISYATNNNVTKESIKISDFNSSIDEEILDEYKLSEKYLTINKNNDAYDVYLGKGVKVTNIDSSIDPFIDIYDYKIYGNSYQDSYTGKNLIDINASTISGIRNNSGVQAWGNTAWDNEWIKNNLDPNTTYTMSCDIECISVPEHKDGEGLTNLGFYLYSGVSGYINEFLAFTGRLLTKGEKIHLTKTFTTPANLKDSAANYRILAYTNSYSNGKSTMKFTNIQIEKGSKATSYEPYVGGMSSPNLEYPQEIRNVGDLITDLSDDNYGKYRIPIKIRNGDTLKETLNIYLDDSLKKLDNYADYIDLKNLKSIKKIKKGMLTENSSFAKFGGVTNYSAFYMTKNDLVNYDPNLSMNRLILSTKFSYHAAGGGNSNSNWTGSYQMCSAIASTYKKILFTLPNTITSVDDAKTWLHSNPIEYYYPFETSDEETISLPNVSNIDTYDNISVDTNIKPSKVEFTVIKKIRQL